MPCNYADYPPNWDEIRERILTRAKHCCEDCFIRNKEVVRKSDRQIPHPSDLYRYHDLIRRDYSPQQAMQIMGFTKIILTIAHLDHDKENWEVTDDRLRALCQKCHLQHDMPRHIENRKYGRNFRKDQLQLFNP